MGSNPSTPHSPADPVCVSDVREKALQTTEPPCRQYYKLVVIGDAGVGSTSFCCRFHSGVRPGIVPSGPCCWWTRYVELNDEKILVELWDLKSTNVHGNKTSHSKFCLRTHGVLFLYSATDRQSFEHLHIWIQHMQRLCGKDVKKLIVATKCDIVNVSETPKTFSLRYGYHQGPDGKVDYFTAKQYADSQGISLIETSSKDNVNIELAILTLVAQIQS